MSYIARDKKKTNFSSIHHFQSTFKKPNLTFQGKISQKGNQRLFNKRINSKNEKIDIVIEETMTYVARSIGPMYRVDNGARFTGNLDGGVIVP